MPALVGFLTTSPLTPDPIIRNFSALADIAAVENIFPLSGIDGSSLSKKLQDPRVLAKKKCMPLIVDNGFVMNWQRKFKTDHRCN